MATTRLGSEFASVEDAIREMPSGRMLGADLALYRSKLDEHGAFAAIEGVFPVCPRHSVLEET